MKLSKLIKATSGKLQFVVDNVCRISYMEIYNETMSDLLSSLSTAVRDHPVPSYQTTALQVIEDDQGGVYVRGLTKHLAQNEEEALNMLFEVFHTFSPIFNGD